MPAGFLRTAVAVESGPGQARASPPAVRRWRAGTKLGPETPSFLLWDLEEQKNNFQSLPSVFRRRRRHRERVGAEVLLGNNCGLSDQCRAAGAPWTAVLAPSAKNQAMLHRPPHVPPRSGGFGASDGYDRVFHKMKGVSRTAAGGEPTGNLIPI